MKKILENKFFWAIAIPAAVLGTWYVCTWNNKRWLVSKIIEKGGLEDTAENRKNLELKNVSELRDQLKNLG